MDKKQARRWFISGQVQGVGFRFFVEKKANQLGVSGWARNLDDGRVEVYAVGTAGELSEMAAALHQGPRMAEVRSVDEQHAVVEARSGFSTR